MTSPVRFGARGLDVRVTDIRLYRDVYYTRGKAVNAIDTVCQLGNDEYLLRQRAESQLLERGAEVFAELQAAAKNADLEVATRAKYLQQRSGKVQLQKEDGTKIVVDISILSDVPVLGAVVCGRFRLERLLGRGAEGSTFLSMDVPSGRALNASSLGANTVSGPSPVSAPARPAALAAVIRV